MNTKIKWYNDPQMIGGLLIFWPPLGLYGIYRSDTVDLKWKKLTTGIIVMVGIVLAMVSLS